MIPKLRLRFDYPSDHTVAQHGGALLVSLVMIFLLSVMGVSAMRGSTLEKQMTNNAIAQSVTFQAAESASDLTLNTPQNLTRAYIAGLGKKTDFQIDEVTTGIGLNSVSTLEYIGSQPATGFSTGVQTSGFESLLYISTGVSSIDTVRAQSTVEQGAYRVVPSRQ